LRGRDRATALLLAGSLASPLALAACGGGSSGPVAQQADATTATTAPTTTSTPPAASTTATRTVPPAAPRTTTTPAPSTTPATTPTKPVAAAPKRAQRPSKPPPAKATPTGPPPHAIQETARLTLVTRTSPIQYSQHGTVSGTLDGEMALDAKVTPKGVAVTFTVQASDGTVSGQGLAIPQITGGPVARLTGTVSVTTGTGAYAHIQGRGLRVTGSAALDGSKATVRLSGTVFY
jgi:hypothetical protein